MKKKLFLYLLPIIFALPLLATADHSVPHLIEQIKAQIAALQAQLAALTSQVKFESSDRVEAIVNLKIRSMPSRIGNVVATAPVRATGVVRCDLAGAASSSCPTKADGYTWWYIDWDSPALSTGWSAEGSSEAVFLQKISLSSTSQTTWGCQYITQGAAPGPDTPVVCGYMPTCSPELSLVAGLGEGSWPDGSRKGVFGCAADLPPQAVSVAEHSLKVIVPNDGERWQKGSTRTIQWLTNGSISRVNIFLEPAPCVSQTGQYCAGFAIKAIPIAINLPNTGAFDWTIQFDTDGKSIPTGAYLIRIEESPFTSTYLYDYSDVAFIVEM